MTKLQPQIGAAVVRPANDNLKLGETEASRIFKRNPGSKIAVVHHVAFQIGMLVSIDLLTRERAKRLLEFQMEEVRNFPREFHADVYEQFDFGCHQIGDITEVIGDPDSSPTLRFEATWFDDVVETIVKEEILSGVFGLGEFSALVAKPGTAKSVLAADIGMHIAAGRDWHGRKVKQGLVVFFAAERKSLTERRVAAWRKHHEISEIPFVVVGGKLDLTANLTDAKALTAFIQELEIQSGQACVWVVLDTLSRTFGGGDQNAAKDMGKYVSSVDEVLRAIGCHVTVIHHSTWNEDRGKGAIDLDGAIDASFSVKRLAGGKAFAFECTGANDADEGVISKFSLESVELCADANGKLTTAPVVIESQLGSLANEDASRPVVLKGQRQEIATALTDGMTQPEWMDAYLKTRTNVKIDSAKRAFRRYLNELVTDGLITETDSQYRHADNGQNADMSG